MEDFRKILVEYRELVQAYKSGEMEFVTCAEKLSPKEVQLFCAALNDIYESVKLPKNRGIVLQEISSENGIVLSDSSRVLMILKMRALLAGLMQNVEAEDISEFAMEGDSGYASLRLRVVEDVVGREKAGVDYQPDNEQELV